MTRFKQEVWHGESGSVVYLIDSAAPGGEQPAVVYSARLSAPGYLDCTDWSGPYATEEEAIQAACELYGVDGDGNELEEE